MTDALSQAFEFAQAMMRPATSLQGLSKGTIAYLKASPFRTVAELRDEMIGNRKTPGVGPKRFNELLCALRAAGVLPVVNGHLKSALLIAEHAHTIGYNEGLRLGADDVEEKYQTQVVRFEATNATTIEMLRAKVLKAYREEKLYVAFRAVLTYDVPLLGDMEKPGEIVLPVDTLYDMLDQWRVGQVRDVSGGSTITSEGRASRHCRVSYNFDTRKGTLEMQPPTPEAAARAKQTLPQSENG